jgi:hypothetical protein
MSFKPVRTFLSDRLLEVDSDFQSHNDAFALDNVGADNFDKRFHIFYGNVTTSVSNQNTTQDVVQATVTLYFNGDRYDSEAIDEAMDIANQYRINCLRPSYLKTQTFIKRVVCNSINAAPLDSNDNAILVTLQYSINMIFGTGVDLNC